VGWQDRRCPTRYQIAFLGPGFALALAAIRRRVVQIMAIKNTICSMATGRNRWKLAEAAAFDDGRPLEHFPFDARGLRAVEVICLTYHIHPYMSHIKG